MTREEFENKHIDLINDLIHLNSEIEEVWAYHPENSNRIDPIHYHAILVEKANQLETKIDALVKQYGSL
jgi:hypothetical protein